MPSLQALQNRLSMIEEQSYYEILRVPSGAPSDDVKAAFHDFALDVHPDRFVDASEEEARVAADIFKRGVEAYKVLSNPKQRAAYDEGLLKGKLRFVEGKKDSEPPVVRELTLEEIAIRPRAKEHARKADRFLAAGRTEEARVALVSAIQEDLDNEELQAKLRGLYTSMAQGPLSLDLDYGPRKR